MNRFRTHSLRSGVRLAAAALFFTGWTTPQAFAANKDMIQLQTQVQQLLDAVARLQQSNDERMGVMKDLVQQTADSINRMSVVVNGLQLRIQNQQDALSAKSDQVSGQIQSLNDSLDELKARLGRMEKALADVQSQQQANSAALAAAPQGNSAAPANGANALPAAPQTAAPPDPQAPAADTTVAVPARTAGPSAETMYRTAYSDYMSGKYSVATLEFGDLIKAYPDDNLSGNAYFYLGEMAMKANKPSPAVADYDHVLERYPDNPKIPAAHLHKAQALINSKREDAAVTELRSLIQRFPNSPEASQARAKLNALGVSSRR